jgi:magnesium transporter
MTTRAFLYDAEAADQEVELSPDLPSSLKDQQVPWLDVCAFDDDELTNIARILNLKPDFVQKVNEANPRPRLDNYGRYFQLNVTTIEENDGKSSLGELHFVIINNLVLTLHKDPVSFLVSFDRRVRGDSNLGLLDAAAFLALFLDWHVTSYFRIIEGLEKQIDRLDGQAIRPRKKSDLLLELAKMRQRVGLVRRILTPHREVYSALARPDFQMLSNSPSAESYLLLHDRLERSIEAVENARELLVGSFDMFTTHLALRTNEAIKALTIASFIWFPASVIVGIAGLILRTPVYGFGAPGFWITMGLIGAIGIITLAFSRWKRWI